MPIDLQPGDWVRTGHDGCFKHEGHISKVAGSVFYLKDEVGVFSAQAIINHMRFLCECGNRRPHDDYACEECKR